jgi:hypothetical protein
MLKPMKALRRDILGLIQIYIEKEDNFEFFNQAFFPALQNLMTDFVNSDPQARDPETLMLFATIIKKDGQHIAPFLTDILNNLCQSTL